MSPSERVEISFLQPAVFRKSLHILPAFPAETASLRHAEQTGPEYRVSAVQPFDSVQCAIWSLCKVVSMYMQPLCNLFHISIFQDLQQNVAFFFFSPGKKVSYGFMKKITLTVYILLRLSNFISPERFLSGKVTSHTFTHQSQLSNIRISIR